VIPRSDSSLLDFTFLGFFFKTFSRITMCFTLKNVGFIIALLLILDKRYGASSAFESTPESFHLVPTEDQAMMKTNDHEEFQWSDSAEDLKLWGPRSAFKRQTKHSWPWMGMPAGRFPQIIYYEFENSVIIAKFGFRNRISQANNNNPINFKFVGSDNCPSSSSSWVTLKSVEDVSWTNQDEEKTWDVGKENRQNYKCYGISVTKISGEHYAGIQDLKFWSAKPKEITLLKLDGAEYKATSVHDGDETKFGPNRAFARAQFNSQPSLRSFPWVSAKQAFPHTVSVTLPRAVSALKFSFRSRPEPVSNYQLDWITGFSPTQFDFIGSNDCDTSYESWTIILSDADVKWTKSDQEKIWVIPNGNQGFFKCYGFRVLGSSDPDNEAAIQDAKLYIEKPVEYAVVTAADGTAHASSVYSSDWAPMKAFNNLGGYWCTKQKPPAPVYLWFQFNEAKRVVKIKFDEPYKMSGEDGYEVFASNEVDKCGEKDNQHVLAVKAAASVFKTGKEFKNDFSFRCYGIRTYDRGDKDYVAVKHLKFGIEE